MYCWAASDGTHLFIIVGVVVVVVDTLVAASVHSLIDVDRIGDERILILGGATLQLHSKCHATLAAEHNRYSRELHINIGMQIG